MLALLLKLLIGPTLVWASTLTARRWGERLAGAVSALPVIAGPVLLIDAQEHGDAFAARAASATLLGIVALSGFIVAVAWAAQLRGWRGSLALGWLTFAVLAGSIGTAHVGPVSALTAAGTALVGASLMLPGAAKNVRDPVALAPGWDLPIRVLVTFAAVASLSAVSGPLGPAVGGVLIAFPVLASVLVAFTHNRLGRASVVELLRGMVSGLGGFVVFCALVGVLVERVGVAAAFATATIGALAAQGASVRAALAAAR